MKLVFCAMQICGRRLKYHRRRVWLLPILMLWCASPRLLAQAENGEFDATRLYQPLDLNGVWRVRAESNASDATAYAQAGYDDSGWDRLDIKDSLHSLFPKSEPGIVWFRRRVSVNPEQAGIALREETLARAFEIYVNGKRVMTLGQMMPLKSYSYNAPLLARIPQCMAATGTLEIAVRAAISSTDWTSESPGLTEGNLTLGEASTLAQVDWLELIGQNLFRFLDAVLIIGAGFVALVNYAAQRTQREYLWIFGLGMVRLAELPVQWISLLVNVPVRWQFLPSVFMMASPVLWAGMYFAFVKLRIGWKFGIFLAVAGGLNCYSNLGNNGLVPQLQGSYGLLTNLPFATLLALVIPIILAVHWRQGNREAGILLIPTIFFSLYVYANYALAMLLYTPGWAAIGQRGLLLIQHYPVGPFAVSLDNVSGIASTLALVIIMILRSTRMSRQQALLEGELAAAREVQQVILPEAVETIPGFTIESMYQPAQEVGGDFFQVISTRDGGLLLVLGDIAGKGLPAAMLVSVMVGAIRATAEYTSEPAEILRSLNERLIGRSRGGFSTALAAHLSADGLVTIANAGHLSPYLDGREIELPGALPLGILGGLNYESKRFQLGRGQRLTFYSDGVVEAQNERGELLGFERGLKLSTRSAREIVAAATQFGQIDDITVVAVSYNPAMQSAA